LDGIRDEIARKSEFRDQLRTKLKELKTKDLSAKGT
jgi:hypothetical protein